MRVLESFDDFIAEPHQNYVITVGNFDGVHLGHQHVLKKVHQIATKHSCKSVVITFKNHPSEVLRPDQIILKLCTEEQKLDLLEQAHVDIVLQLTFTKEFSQQTAEMFLEKINRTFPIAQLILGHDAAIGRNREGNWVRVKEYAKRHHIEVRYLKPYVINEHPVSSTWIRKSIREGNFDLTQKLLGRPYTIMSKVITGMGKGVSLGYPTANISLSGLCLPPYGVYLVVVKTEDQISPAIANLGVAPTMRTNDEPLLEVHFLEETKNLVGTMIEVLFMDFLRAEKKFDHESELKEQIKLDVSAARAYFNMS